MTYKQLINALSHAKELTEWQNDIPYKDDGQQHAYSKENWEEFNRFKNLLNSEIDWNQH